MPLPSLIEIVPPSHPLRAEIVVPGSKSITNRALVLAALADGRTRLEGALWSEDTQVMVECLGRLGFEVRVESDSEEPCNRAITVQGLAGRIPDGGTVESPVELFVGNAGTAARFLAALVCLGRGAYRLHGVARMHERPQEALFAALRELGYRIESPNNRLPAIVHGGGSRPGACRVSIEQSSQFASALLLSSKVGGWRVDVAGENEEESPYVAMTARVMDVFPGGGGSFQIEPDASSGSYFRAAGQDELEPSEAHGGTGGGRAGGWTSRPTVRVAHWPESGWQMDAAFARLFSRVTQYSPLLEIVPAEHRARRAGEWREWKGRHEKALAEAMRNGGSSAVESLFSPVPPVSRRTDLGDSIMTAITMAPLAAFPIRFTDLGRLRLQECERVEALRTELARCGARVVEIGDTLEVYPSSLHGAEIETYNDHRMAMCFAILGLKVPGIRIKNPACVKKTFPNFFQKLAGPRPAGLGVVILHGDHRQPVRVGDLFAD